MHAYSEAFQSTGPRRTLCGLAIVERDVPSLDVVAFLDWAVKRPTMSCSNCEKRARKLAARAKRIEREAGGAS
jgi:hypothetical protein